MKKTFAEISDKMTLYRYFPSCGNSGVYSGVESLCGNEIKRTEVRSVSFRIGPYAQYPASLGVVFVEKGKRRAKLWESQDPWFVLVEGHKRPDFDIAATKDLLVIPGIIASIRAPQTSVIDVNERDVWWTLDEYLQPISPDGQGKHLELKNRFAEMMQRPLTDFVSEPYHKYCNEFDERKVTV